MSDERFPYKFISSTHERKLAKMETNLIMQSFQNQPSTSISMSSFENTFPNSTVANIETTYNDTLSEAEELSQSEQNIEIIENVINNSTESSDYPLDEEFDNESGQNQNFQQFLANWAVQEHISQSSLRSLLHGIKKYTCHNCNFNIPSDPRSLLRTPRSTNVSNCSGGQYYHFGLLEGILDVISSSKKNIDHISISVNIDGLPLSKSSSQQFWPILGSITGFKQIFIIGIYYGTHKPVNSNEYLKKFIDDTKVICEQGIVNNNTNVSCTIDSIICDAPAKAFILQVKGHSGYSSCTKCSTEGAHMNSKMCFPEINASLRTDEDFRLKKDDSYHIGDTILLEIPNFNMVDNIPLDYMHLVCLGVVRKLIYLWLFGDLKNRLRANKIAAISSQFENNLKLYIPCEFVRKPRSLTYVKQ